MSYYSIHENDQGTFYWEDDDGTEHELVVSYEYWERGEPHSYGDATVYERVSDTEIIEWQLDGIVKTYQDLVDLWGKILAEERTYEAIR